MWGFHTQIISSSAVEKGLREIDVILPSIYLDSDWALVICDVCTSPGVGWPTVVVCLGPKGFLGHRTFRAKPRNVQVPDKLG